jgi:hypothetical protein
MCFHVQSRLFEFTMRVGVLWQDAWLKYLVMEFEESWLSSLVAWMDRSYHTSSRNCIWKRDDYFWKTIGARKGQLYWYWLTSRYPFGDYEIASHILTHHLSVKVSIVFAAARPIITRNRKCSIWKSDDIVIARIAPRHNALQSWPSLTPSYNNVCMARGWRLVPIPDPPGFPLSIVSLTQKLFESGILFISWSSILIAQWILDRPANPWFLNILRGRIMQAVRIELLFSAIVWSYFHQNTNLFHWHKQSNWWDRCLSYVSGDLSHPMLYSFD